MNFEDSLNIIYSYTDEDNSDVLCRMINCILLKTNGFFCKNHFIDNTKKKYTLTK